MDKIKINTLKVSPIKQFQKKETEKGVYFGIWSFREIEKSIKFTHREPLEFNILSDINTTKKKFPEFNSDYYQRLIDDERTKKVIQFIIKEIKDYNDPTKQSLITFPTSLILSLYLSEANSINEYLEELINLKNDENHYYNTGVYFQNNEISLPDINIMLVVDGQHRLAGLYAIYNALLVINNEINDNENNLDRKIIDYAYKSITKLEFDANKLKSLKEQILDFQFSCTVLLDFDIWEQGKVFADVNFNQKPVNKSLYYDIFGSYPDPEKNDIYLAHTWAVYLNSNEKSALYNKIKLLGYGTGYFSQASFVEALLPMLRKNGIWNNIVSDFIFKNYINNNIQDFLFNYFLAIKETYIDYWPSENIKPSSYKDILIKTTGLTAIIKLIPHIYPKIKDIENNGNVNLKQEIITIFKSGLQKQIDILTNNINSLNNYLNNNEEQTNKIKLLDEIQNKKEELKTLLKKQRGEYYFSKDGNFAKGAGKGLQDRLYKELKHDLDL